MAARYVVAFMFLQDYVKWRGPLFHRFLLALIDDSPKVAALAEFLLGDTLASKVGGSRTAAAMKLQCSQLKTVKLSVCDWGVRGPCRGGPSVRGGPCRVVWQFRFFTAKMYEFWPQAPLLAYNHFVEALFVLNDCQAGLHAGGAAAAALANDVAASSRDAFCLKGSSPRTRGQRDAIYKCDVLCFDM